MWNRSTKQRRAARRRKRRSRVRFYGKATLTIDGVTIGTPSILGIDFGREPSRSVLTRGRYEATGTFRVVSCEEFRRALGSP